MYDKSLSIVPGSPITFTPNLFNFAAPLNDPSPPTTTKLSILCFFSTSTAFSLPASSINSILLAVFNIVPPNSAMLSTSKYFNFFISSSINP